MVRFTDARRPRASWRRGLLSLLVALLCSPPSALAAPARAAAPSASATCSQQRQDTGLPSNIVTDAAKVGSTWYVATQRGLAVSTDDGVTFQARTTANGLGGPIVNAVVATDARTVYAATNGGLGISTDGGARFTNYAP
jgi:hypothetical protein